MHCRQKCQVFGGQARRCLEQLDVFLKKSILVSKIILERLSVAFHIE